MRRSATLPAFLVFAMAIGWAVAQPANAQAQAVPGRGGEARVFTQRDAPVIVVRDGESQQAREVRSEFRRVLERYPPVLGKMLKLDPGLMNNAAYLAPYPAIAAYLQQHPEIPRDPAYFLDFVNTGDNRLNDPETWRQERMVRVWNDFMLGLMVFGIVVATGIALAWIVRYIIDHRRWLRATKIQSEMQNKLLERMSSSNELLAYVQSPAGQRLLQGTPVSIEPAPSRSLVAPLRGIVVSVQIGFILAAGGAGLLVARPSIGLDFQGVALVIGTIGVSLGIGFGLAAAASYLISQKLGLFDANPDKMRASGGL